MVTSHYKTMHSNDRLCFELDYHIPCFMLKYKAWLHSIYQKSTTRTLNQFDSITKEYDDGNTHSLVTNLVIPFHSISYKACCCKYVDRCCEKKQICVEFKSHPPTLCFIMKKNRKERASEKRKIQALKKALKKTTLSPLNCINNKICYSWQFDENLLLQSLEYLVGSTPKLKLYNTLNHELTNHGQGSYHASRFRFQ